MSTTASGRRRALAAIVVAQTVGELVYVGSRSDLVVGMRVFLMCIVALQLVFAQGVLRLSAGSVFGLLVLQCVTAVAAAVGDGPVGVRLILLASAVTVIGLVLASLSEFPSVTLPRSTTRT
jgi:hypothetical protein